MSFFNETHLFCDTPIWDSEASWNTTSPVLTKCFRQSILSLVPIASLIFILSYDLFFLSKKWSNNSPPVPWQWTNRLNLLVIFLSMAISTIYLITITWQVIDGCQKFLIASFQWPVLNLISYLILTYLVVIFRRRNYLLLICQPMFWLINILCLILNIWSMCKKSTIDSIPEAIFSIATLLISTCGLVVSCQPLKSKHYQRLDAWKCNDYCPRSTTNILSRITFTWTWRFLIRNYKINFEPADLKPLCSFMRSSVGVREFDKNYKNFRCPKKRLFLILYQTSWFTLLIVSILAITSSFLSIAPPLIIARILDFVASDEPVWHGFFFAFLFSLTWLVKRILDAHTYVLLQTVSIRSQSALISAIYSKMLRLSPASRKKHDAGEINNYMHLDSQQTYQFIEVLNDFYLAPLNLILATVILWQFIGLSSLGLVGVMLVIGPITSVILNQTDKLWDQKMEISDKRMKRMSEILNNIKMLKLFAWEKPFMERVAELRKAETRKILIIHFWYAINDLVWSWSWMLVAAACFATFILTSGGVFDAKVAFVSLSVISSLGSTMATYPDVFVKMIRANVSCRRLREYFEAEEVEPNPNRILKSDSSLLAVGTVLIKNSSFSWDPKEEHDKVTLDDIDIRVTPGSLIAIVGRVGSGKSSLFSALLGDMYQVKGEPPTIVGSLAYVPQTAWIQNSTLKKNITFVNELYEEKYKKVISSCALEPDLAILPGGDQTEIGEKGINLSGGQKQRVSLARAVYQDADIYLLDDPLSAVDAHVAHQLFKQVIGPDSLLKDKTRLLATHHLSFLKEVDSIIVMKNGKIVGNGTFDQMQLLGLLQEINETDKMLTNGADEPKSKLERQISAISTMSRDSKTSEDMLLINRQTSTLSDNQKVKDQDASYGQLIEEESQEVGRVKLINYWEYIKLVGIWIFILAMAVELGNKLSEQSANYWLNLWTANSNQTTVESPVRNTNLWIYLSLVAVEAVFIVLGNNFLFIGSRNAAVILHKKMLYSVLRSPLSFFDVTPIGRILNRFNRDIFDVDEQIPLNFKWATETAVWFPFVLVIISMVSIYLLLVILVIAIMFYGLAKLYLWAERQFKRIGSITRSPLFSHFNESINGVSTIRAYNVQQLFTNEMNRRIDVDQNCYFNSNLVMQWIEVWSGIVGIIFMLAVSCYIVANRQSMTQSMAGLLMTYLIETINSLNWLTRVTTWLESNMVAVERISGFIKLKPEAEWQSDDDAIGRRFVNWPRTGKIEFKNYTARYRPELEPVLKNLSVTIDSGEKIGVVGRTGAGKSSLTMALFRIIEPISGKIIIDDVDVAEIGLHDLRSKLTIIPQEPILFAGTLRVNLDPFEEHSDEKLWQALEDSHLKDLVSNFPDGLLHEITASGDNLSAGQRQLVCLARALLRDSKILVLDEATAACDNETDQLIQVTIRSKFNSSTIITIAHRLNTILDYDRILVIADGTIVEIGSPKLLLNQSDSLFFEMAKEAGIVKQ